ncbi:MAG TPA: 3-deoxy-7-phosphoheptulonate synthase [Ktedonobacteraceae bacterium]|nr:3-deoxy-7-phosphoheptulonate synthase [Ktedonobacteraceae bacterium]
MIIVVRKQAGSEERARLIEILGRMLGTLRPLTVTHMREREVVTVDNSNLDAQALATLRQQPAVEDIVTVQTPYKLVSRAFQPASTVIEVGDSAQCQPVTIGGGVPVVMAGPCAVENREQLLTTARAVKDAGAQVLRGGAFKPRTSPYQFQGLGLEGLELLAQAREITGLPIITEVMEPALVTTVAEYADILQIGARNMQNYPLLLAAGRQSRGKPVMLKRGLSSTIEEWLLAAEYIVAAGNPNVILCERGVRSFDPLTRNVLDLTCVPLLHQLTHLPVIVDPSHATGRRELVPTMSRAGIAAGANGLILEVHPDPDAALCDGKQSITPEQLWTVVQETQLMARLMNGEFLPEYVA